jgi:hypothetical protein
MAPVIPDSWAANWMWGLPLIVLVVIMHAAGLGLINNKIASKLGSTRGFREPSAFSVLIVGAVVLAVTVLHGLEGLIWALAYSVLGALPDYKSAMLYSLNAITSYGHDNLTLEPRWAMMGALEALNGCIMFGLTTAFLFTLMQKLGYQRQHENTHSSSPSITPV